MADVTLKNKQGVRKTYEGVESVALKTPDGDEEIFSRGGGSPQAVQFVTLTPTSMTTASSNKTNAEIYALINAGIVVKIDITLGSYRFTADVSTTAENIDPEDASYEMTNLIALLPNIPNSAFYVISTGDVSADNTEWNLSIVPFSS